jgi:ABC-type multidrug transport system ATPase subunit
MKIKAMSKTLGGRKILSLDAMELEKGKIYAVLGSNGSGKSTFARLLAGVVKPDRGRELVEQGVRVGYLPQKPYVFRMSLLKNLRLSGANPEQAAEQAESFGLSALAGQNAKKLSGERQPARPWQGC